MVRNGYITYISNGRDYKAVLNLAFNLTKVRSKFPLYCICLEDVSESIIDVLQSRGISVVKFNLRSKLEEINMNIEQIKFIKDKHLFGKFAMFNIPECEKFVYLDTDVLILQNIDHLFGINTKSNIFMVHDMQADSDYSKVILIKNKFNSGVILSNYNKNIYETMYQLLFENIDKLTIDDKELFVSDQYIFEILHRIKNFSIKQLDIAYNIHPILVESAVNKKIIKEPLIIHFMMKPKPWDIINLRAEEYKFENSKCREYFLLWINMYYELMTLLYFKDTPDKSNIKSYHWGVYNNENKLEYENNCINTEHLD